MYAGISMHVCMHLFIHVCIFMHGIYVCLCMHIWMHMCIDIFLYIFITMNMVTVSKMMWNPPSYWYLYRIYACLYACIYICRITWGKGHPLEVKHIFIDWITLNEILLKLCRTNIPHDMYMTRWFQTICCKRIEGGTFLLYAIHIW